MTVSVARWLGRAAAGLSLGAALLAGCPGSSQVAPAETPSQASQASAAATPAQAAAPAKVHPSQVFPLPNSTPEASTACLPVRSGDLASFFTPPRPLAQGGPKLVPISRGTPRFMAAFNAALSWVNADCLAFRDFAFQMGYEATELVDSATGDHHWLLTELAGRHNGVFALRAPRHLEEPRGARPLVVLAPHAGADFRDDRAVRLYRELKAVALLQNSADPCSLTACAGCNGAQSDACGGCARESDVAHSVDQLFLAVFIGIEATRKDLHLELHGGEAQLRPGCPQGVLQLSQGPGERLTAAADEGTFPSRLWHGTASRLGAQCVCYAQRQDGCSATESVLGRLSNESPSKPFDPCGIAATRRSGRYVSLAGQGPIAPVIAALAEAVPLK